MNTMLLLAPPLDLSGSAGYCPPCGGSDATTTAAISMLPSSTLEPSLSSWMKRRPHAQRAEPPSWASSPALQRGVNDPFSDSRRRSGTTALAILGRLHNAPLTGRRRGAPTV